jgi:DNA-binding transcriptional regulator YiaG
VDTWLKNRDPLDQANANTEMRDPYDAAFGLAFDVRALREGMKLSQREFAGWFGFPVATLRHWERGNRRPRGTALVLLEVIRDNPGAVLRAVRKARGRDGSRLAAIESPAPMRAPPGFGERLPALRPRGPRRR